MTIVMDIDICDAKHSLAVADYVGDLYAYYRKVEASILIDWLIEVHYKFELREETLFLTVNLIDRFLCKDSMERKKLQLVGLATMLLACKYEEVSVPIVGDMIFISDKAYTRNELLKMIPQGC